MVALKGGEIEAFLARPDPARPIALVFGPDAGLVAERAKAILRASVDDLRDPFSLVRLEGDDLADDPMRLVDNSQTVPLFGGRRAISVRAGGRGCVVGSPTHPREGGRGAGGWRGQTGPWRGGSPGPAGGGGAGARPSRGRCARWRRGPGRPSQWPGCPGVTGR